jgi:hypothetical protein
VEIKLTPTPYSYEKHPDGGYKIWGNLIPNGDEGCCNWSVVAIRRRALATARASRPMAYR